MSDEDLIRYLLGDATEPEKARIERKALANSDFSKRLDQLRDCLSDSSKSPRKPADGVPDGLAARTADSVADLSVEGLRLDAISEASYPETDVATSAHRFSLADLLAVSFVLVLLGMVVAPALTSSRSMARRLACEQNLTRLGQSLLAYATDHGNRFPDVGPYRNAGLFTVLLADGGYVERSDLQQIVLCPSSELAQQVTCQSATVWVPTQWELYSTNALLFDRAKRFMAGSYAYRLGHFEANRYVPLRYRGDARAALVSDAPAAERVGATSPNHGCGQNVLFQDGSIKFQSGCRTVAARDHLFLNHAGEVAAGHSWSDAVLVRSEIAPLPPRLVRVGR